MSDFFENLAARSIGAASALRPRLPSHYEARRSEGLEVIEELTPAAAPTVRDPMRMRDAGAATSVAPERSASMEPVAPPERLAPPERILIRDVVLAPAEPRAIDEEHVHEETGASRDETGLPRVDGDPQAGVAAAKPRATQPPRSLDFARDDSSAHEHASSEPGARESARESSRRHPDRERVRPIGGRAIAHVRPTQPSPSPRERATLRAREQLAAEPAVVHVTIGRVEVRAVQPQPPAPRPAPPPAPPGPTLEEFLEQRERRT